MNDTPECYAGDPRPYVFCACCGKRVDGEPHESFCPYKQPHEVPAPIEQETYPREPWMFCPVCGCDSVFRKGVVSGKPIVEECMCCVYRRNLEPREPFASAHPADVTPLDYKDACQFGSWQNLTSPDVVPPRDEEERDFRHSE